MPADRPAGFSGQDANCFLSVIIEDEGDIAGQVHVEDRPHLVSPAHNPDVAEQRRFYMEEAPLPVEGPAERPE